MASVTSTNNSSWTQRLDKRRNTIANQCRCRCQGTTREKEWKRRRAKKRQSLWRRFPLGAASIHNRFSDSIVLRQPQPNIFGVLFVLCFRDKIRTYLCHALALSVFTFYFNWLLHLRLNYESTKLIRLFTRVERFVCSSFSLSPSLSEKFREIWSESDDLQVQIVAVEDVKTKVQQQQQKRRRHQSTHICTKRQIIFF